MTVTANKPAPYAPPTAILELIERHRSRGLPSPVNADVLERAGILCSLIPRTLQALQALDLIDKDGKPTDTLESICLAPEAEYKQCLAEWLNGTYADVIAYVDPAKDGATKIRDAFRSYEPVGQQPRMVTLFIGLYHAAGLAAEKQATSPRRAHRAPAKPASKRKPRTLPANPSSEKIPAALSGLLSSLPAEGEGWTQEQRDKFLKTFGAVLDFCFKTIEDAPEEYQEEAQNE